MDTAVLILALSTVPQLSAHIVPNVTIRAAVEVIPDLPRIFSGESLRLRCSVPDDEHRSSWDYAWFRGSQKLVQTGSEFTLWRAKVAESGKFSCQGMRDSAVGYIRTLKSLPVQIDVDGGWAILAVPTHPGLVGNNLTMDCRVRLKHRVHERILYLNGVEVKRQRQPYFQLTNLTLADEGMYTCRASADSWSQTLSVISAPTYVQVLEVLTEPVLEIDTKHQVETNKMRLKCHVQYNARVPAPPINFYFYKNNNRLGVATSENHSVVTRTTGLYSCKAKVPALGLSKWSEPKRFVLERGSQTIAPPLLHPNHQQPIVPPARFPEPSMTPPVQPVKSESPQKMAQPTQHTPSETAQYSTPTNAPGSLDGATDSGKLLDDIYNESGHIFDESGELLKESLDILEHITNGSEDIADESSENSKDMLPESVEVPDDSEESGEVAEESGEVPEDLEESGEMPDEYNDDEDDWKDEYDDDSEEMNAHYRYLEEEYDDEPEESVELPEGSGDKLEDLLSKESGNMSAHYNISEESEKAPEDLEESGEVPEDLEESGEVPEDSKESGEVPEDSKESGEVPEDLEESGEMPDEYKDDEDDWKYEYDDDSEEMNAHYRYLEEEYDEGPEESGDKPEGSG